MDRQVAEARLKQVLCGKYTLESVLGVGGMATVYRATHRNGHKAAVKILHPHLAAYAGIRERFVKEAYTANRLEHPGALSITDDDVAEDGAAFLVMELLDGETLDAWSERCGPALPPAEVSRAMHDVLDVLIAAHRHGVIHRDLKPENIFRTRDGRIKVLDFGIARAIFDAAPSQTRTGSLLGTPAYMPPEQACGRIREIDGRTDLWAVGATAFALLSGRTVHSQDTVELLHVAAATQPAPPLRSVAPTVPAGLAAVVDCALAFDKQARWANAREMQAALEVAHLAAFGEPLVSPEQVALQATLLPESLRLPSASAETTPPSLGPSSLPSAARPGAGAPLRAASRPEHPAPVGASTTGAVVSERAVETVRPGAQVAERPAAIPVERPSGPRRGVWALGIAGGVVTLALAGVALRAAGTPAAASLAVAPPPPTTTAPAADPPAAPVVPVTAASDARSAEPTPPLVPTPQPTPTGFGKRASPVGPARKTEPKPDVPVAPAPAASAAPPAPKPNCNPPYTLKDGIEVMKPECAHK